MCHVTEVPGRQIYWDAGAIQRAGEDISHGKNYQIMGIDYDFMDMFDLTMLKGRNFSKEFSTDDKNLILNETAVKWMGFQESENPVGQQVQYWDKLYTIVGVIKDYHQQSLKEAFEPTLFRFLPTGRGNRGQFAIKINTRNTQETVRMVEDYYVQFFPGNPYNFFFLDDYYNQQYHADELFGRVIGLFSLLAIIVTSLGILGLSAYSASQRTKEIGIRKVLGANESSIVYLLTKNFFVLLLFAFIITLPLVFWGVNQWLDNFANRMSLNGWMFIIPLVIVWGITLLTVSFQAIRVAVTNPVESLRYE
jgi:putative ABC transport system permease protein